MSERIIIDRTTTWHAIGKDVQECKSMEQVLRASGLDYEVTKYPIFFPYRRGDTQPVYYHPRQ